jgi:alkaline phosphatase D
MRYKVSGVIILLSVFLNSIAQRPIVAGPMLGYVELRTAKIWVQFDEKVERAKITYRVADETKPAAKTKKSSASSSLLSKQINLEGGEFNTGVFELTGLEPGTSYKYLITTNINSSFIDSGKFVTQELWQYRKPPSDFSFLAGSCVYFNQPEYDRPGKPYGGDSSIFDAMAKEKSAFMLWLGDNWYTRYPDYASEWGLHYRPSRERRLKVLQPFLKAMSHYAIWDDHDYGPNDADKSYVLKEASRKVFMKYWPNPTYGMNGNGIYTAFTYNDAEFFLLDDRWFRSSDRMMDSVNGNSNKEKKMFGDEQMEWLKNALLFSRGNTFTKFRVIVTGSQVLNGYSKFDALRAFPAEHAELLSFLEKNKIGGVIFVTGDRHHSEIIKMERKNAYTLYDVTSSPITSSPAKTQGAEINNPMRVGKEIDEENYARFSITGEGKDRKMRVEFIGPKGDVLDTWEVKASDISF